MAGSARAECIREVLQAHFAPIALMVEDESELHRGHAGAASGKGHFAVRVVAASFEGQSLLMRHRRIYAALSELLATDVHALSISALTPDEAGA
jgi:BolA protein